MKTRDISGFGGSYENECQKMLHNGLIFLENNPGLQYDFKSFQNVTGICIAETENAKNLDKAIMDGVDDATGAMHHAVISHLLYINRNGKEKWLQIDGDIFEWDGTDKSCPRTEISTKMDSK